jgi:ribosomal-protein-alanine N-acetyltransferase
MPGIYHDVMSPEPRPRVSLRRVTHADRDAFLAMARLSLDLHRPWVTSPTTPEAFDRYLARFDGVRAIGHVLVLADALVGFVNLNDIGDDGAMIGFGVFAPAMGRGCMREGLDLALRLAFHDLGLPRVSADVQPSNVPCVRLLKGAGFTLHPGRSTVIHVGGADRLHERWSLAREEFFATSTP